MHYRQAITSRADQLRGDAPVYFRRWESPFTPELSFVETSDHQLAYANHVHDLMEILWVREGHTVLECRDRSYAMSPGDAVIIAPNEVHGGGSSGRSRFSFSTVLVPPALLDAIFGWDSTDDVQAWPMPAVQLISGQLARAMYHDLIGGLPSTRSPADEMACLCDGIGRLMRMPAWIGGAVVPAADCHPAVRRARRIINASFTDAIDIGRLAAEVNLHQRYLISLFKAATGMPPHQYQIAMRVDLGRKLLDREASLSTIASAAGFADQSHFNRLFKRTYRMTPGLFRAQTISV